MKCMKYKNFYNIAQYGNTAWKGAYTAQEIAQNAREYYSDFLTSKNSGGPTFLIRRLMSLLAEDGSEKNKSVVISDCYRIGCDSSELQIL